jgi:hypothetical protein
MRVYSCSNVRQNLSGLLDQARKKGEIDIKRKDGSFFIIKPIPKAGSPLDVSGVDVNISKKEIIETLREIRER